jgi:hypothetical protein
MKHGTLVELTSVTTKGIFMKLALTKLMLLTVFIAVGNSSEAQTLRGRTGSGYQSASSCTCTQTRTLTEQTDGTYSVCQFAAFGGSSGVKWFDGGWFLTGDLVRFDCAGGIAGTGRTTYGNSPSPLCRITERLEEPAPAGRCVHQADTNHDGVRSLDENAAWDVLHTPVTTGPYAGKAAQGAIDMWNQTFAFLINGSDLCDPSRTPGEVSS